jgi:hypothetical protein
VNKLEDLGDTLKVENESSNVNNFFKTSLLGKRKKHPSFCNEEFTRQQIKLPTRIIAQMNKQA